MLHFRSNLSLGKQYMTTSSNFPKASTSPSKGKDASAASAHPIMDESEDSSSSTSNSSFPNMPSTSADAAIASSMSPTDEDDTQENICF